MSLLVSLIYYHPGNEASGNLLDLHTNDLDFTETSGTITSGVGKVYATARQYVAADTEYHERASEALLQTGDIDYSFAVWVYLDSKGSNRIILNKWNNATPGNEYRLQFNNTSDRYEFSAWNSGAVVKTAVGNTYGSPALSTWTLIVCWHDATANTVNIQINNGGVDSTAMGAAHIPADTASVRVGARGSTAMAYWDGRLGPIAFWKKALSSAERTELWNSGAGLTYAGFTPTPTPLGSPTPRLSDWQVELVDLETGATYILWDEIISVGGTVEPGATRHKLREGQLEASPGTAGDPSIVHQSLDWDGWQAIRFLPNGDTSQEFWGLIVKTKESYTASARGFDKIPLTLAPIGYLLHSRVCINVSAPIPGAGMHVDDYAKKLVRYTALPGTVGLDPDGNTRNWEWGTLAVAADAGLCNTLDVGHDGTGEHMQFVDDILNALPAIDDQFFWELLPSVAGGVTTFTFQTARNPGTDRTTGADRWVINDFGGAEPEGERHVDKQGFVSAMYGRGGLDVDIDAATIVKWGRWEGKTDADDPDDILMDLQASLPKEGSTCTYALAHEWMDKWDVNDTVIRNNVRLGIAESSERIAAVKFEFPSPDKILRIDIEWGEREARMSDKVKGGGQRGGGGGGAIRQVIYPAYGSPVEVGGANADGTGIYINHNDHVHQLTISIPTPATVGPNVGDFSFESADLSVAMTTPGAGRIDFSADPAHILHNLLCTSHQDTVAVTPPTRGSLIVGNNDTPCKWEEYQTSPTHAGKYLYTDGTDAYWNTAFCYWARNAGSAYVYPATNDDDVKLVSGAATIWMEAGDGQSHFAGNMYIGSASTAAAQRLHLYDAGGDVWMRTQGGVTADIGVSTVEGNNAAVWRTTTNNSLSIQPGQSETLHINSAGCYIVSGRTLVMDRGVIGSGDYAFYISPAGGGAGVCHHYYDPGTQFMWENAWFQMPTDVAAVGDALVIKAIGAFTTTEWASPTTAAHNLLSATHTDTLEASPPAAGSLVYGNATPVWAELARGAGNTILKSGAATIAWDALLGIPAQSGPGADRIMFWDQSAVPAATKWLTVGTGLSIIDTTISLESLGVAPAMYGDATHVAQVTIDTYGRVTLATDVAISGVPPSAHDVAGALHTITGAAMSVVGATALNTLGLLQPSSAPGANSLLLKSDTSGYLRLERLEINTAAYYVGKSGTNLQINSVGNLQLGIGTTMYVDMSTTTLRPTSSGANAMDLGNAGNSWKDLYLDGDIYFDANKGIIHASGVTAGSLLVADATRFMVFAPGLANRVLAMKNDASTVEWTASLVLSEVTVGGVVMSTHVHNYDKSNTPTAIQSADHTHTISGSTANGQPSATIYVHDHGASNEAYMMYWTSTPGTYTHVYLAKSVAGADAAWVPVTIAIPQIENGDLAHSHAVGTLANGVQSANHNHTINFTATKSDGPIAP